MSAQQRKPAPRVARPVARYRKGKAPQGFEVNVHSDSDEDEDEAGEEENQEEDVGLRVVGQESADDDDDDDEDEDDGGTKKSALKPKMNVTLKDVNIDAKGKVIVGGREESGRTARELESSEEESDEDEAEVKKESDEEESSEEETSSEEESSEEEKPKLAFRPVFVPKRGRATIQEKEGDDPDGEEAVARKKQEEEKRKQDSHQLAADAIKRDLAKKEATEVIPDVDDADGVDPDGEFEAWRLRELGRIKRDKEAVLRREEEKEEIERRRAMPEEQRMKEDLEHAKKSREDKPKGQQKFLQKYYHKGAFHQDLDILKKHDYTEATESAVNTTMLPKIMQVRDFGKRSRTKYTHLVDQDTSLPKDKAPGAGGAQCFLCGGPHLKRDCPQNTAPGGTGANTSGQPSTRKWGIGSRAAEDAAHKEPDRRRRDHDDDRHYSSRRRDDDDRDRDRHYSSRRRDDEDDRYRRDRRDDDRRYDRRDRRDDGDRRRYDRRDDDDYRRRDQRRYDDDDSERRDKRRRVESK